MGRQPYMNLLALGRSPYEAPETPPQGYVAGERRTEDSVNADGYVQEYDVRGHPVNLSSKALARQLRRAKNDILSTMGIVVSGEDGTLGISKERQRMNLLSTENDYGLALATLDQVAMFFSSWWTTSLAARIQFVYSLLKFRSCKLALFVVLGQTYMFSLLQSLHILPPLAVPTLRSLLPFGPTSLIQFPPLPARLSLAGIGNFGVKLLTAPFAVLYMYVYLRPIIESRIYRIIRRKLPKPDHPDILSLRVAAESGLIEWTAPSFGRRSDEEYRRSDLTIGEEFKYELRIFRNWILGIFGLQVDRPSDTGDRGRLTPNSLQNRLEQLSRDFNTSTAPLREEIIQHDEVLVNSVQARGEQLLSGQIEGARPRSPTPDAAAQEQFGTNQILSGDGQRMSQSPFQLGEDYFDQGDPSQGRPGMEEAFRMDPSASPQGPNDQGLEVSHGHHFHSRSNTLFSHPSTPESSPLASPPLVELSSTLNPASLENHEQEPSARPTTPTAPQEPPGTLEPLLEIPESPSARTHRAEPTAALVNDENRNTSQPPSAQPARRSRPGRPLFPDHRVTILSSLPVDSLSSHLASLLTSAFFYPLESMYLRNFATQFLTTPSLLAPLPVGASAISAMTLGLRSDVRDIFGWCGGGSRSDMLAYLAKMGLVVGMEALVSVTVWGMGTAVTVMLGTRKFGWGNL
ncbi:conserved hypothetical protein [Histoplasma capsulatum H143]|uniref:Uncharacterized protein n=1 Tax=Ajellomyces capsulatus (strain H143) TaxID=544712 RepID=C6H4U5_AJECH|nr:conserved hypothetical protein [Histoplasma capsulatum H143]